MRIYAKLFSIALAGLALGACSNEDVVEQGGGASWNSEGTGYVKLAVNLPTTPASRGVNDDFEDGLAAEYAVNNATLVLLSGANEAAATVNSAYDLKLNFSNNGSDAITTTADITQKINSISGTDKIYALVVLNHNGMLSVSDKNVLSAGGAEATGKTLNSLNDALKSSLASWHGAGYLMSNAVLTKAVGGSSYTAGAVQTLVEIDRNSIEATEAEAAANPAAKIYVERAEAKVTVDGAATLSNTTTDGTNLSYTIDGWVLDNTNTTSKLVRTVDGYSTWAGLATNDPDVTNKYRFVGNVSVGTDIAGASLYRVYWGDDYNYATTAVTDLTKIADGAVPANVNALGSDAYCFENTAILSTMRENTCTRVIVKATFNNGQPFFLVDNDVTAMFAETDVKKEVAARVVGDNNINAWLEANLKDGATIESDKDLIITLNDLKAGKVTVKEVALTDNALTKLKEGSIPNFAEWLVAANAHIILEYYAGGSAYYPVYVAHFGDDLTPWDKKETEAPSADNIYPAANADANYLGRWGVLRNNWYQINVTSIRSIGAPTVEQATGTIDKKESYISVTVNTLPWAVRTQNADL